MAAAAAAGAVASGEVALSDAELLRESSLAAVEEAVKVAASTPAAYSPKAARALLRLYSMYPAKANTVLVAQVLAKVRVISYVLLRIAECRRHAIASPHPHPSPTTTRRH